MLDTNHHIIMGSLYLVALLFFTIAHAYFLIKDELLKAILCILYTFLCTDNIDHHRNKLKDIAEKQGIVSAKE